LEQEIARYYDDDLGRRVRGVETVVRTQLRAINMRVRKQHAMAIAALESKREKVLAAIAAFEEKAEPVLR
jgi:hypothetical protein